MTTAPIAERTIPVTVKAFAVTPIRHKPAPIGSRTRSTFVRKLPSNTNFLHPTICAFYKGKTSTFTPSLLSLNRL